MAMPETSTNAMSLTVEEARISKLRERHPEVADRYSDIVDQAKSSFDLAGDYEAMSLLTHHTGKKLWEAAKRTVAEQAILDDRSLYWSRLSLTAYLRASQFAVPLSSNQRISLIERLENSSRGRDSIEFTAGAVKKILVTGFDPFLLDKHIDQSNPSGIVALNLDGQTLTYGQASAEIQTVIFPVRFEDFDAGEVEQLIEPLLKTRQVDMIVTVSMGRTDFDLEHFPGRRRSSGSPDNLNVYSGGDETKPKIPLLNGAVIDGPEFLEFSLPYRAMQRVILDAKQDANKQQGEVTYPYLINDNRTITTLDGTFEAKTLAELKGATAVRGSGGGYLSNEISYRNVRLAHKYQPLIPTGHIHTPRLERYDAEQLKTISNQVTEMIRYAIIEI
jgi:pyrrolidone-carboxylate peptidase